MTSRWPLLVAAAFSIYSVLLISNVSSSQSQLRAEKNLRIVADSKRRAGAVSDLIAERRVGTTELAESGEIESYFINKSLGMSLRYGLNASLGAIEERFRRQVARSNLRGEHIFNRIVFYDETGQILVDLAPAKGRLPALSPTSGRTSLLTDLKLQQIVISAPVMYKGVKNGTVATIGDIRQISRDLINPDASGSYRELLLTDSGLELPGVGNPVHLDEQVNNALSKLPADVLVSLDDLALDRGTIGGHLAVRTKIPETGLSLVTILSREAAYGQVSSRFFLYSASAFPLILLIAAILFDRVRRVGVALAQSEQRFRTIFDNVRDVIFVVDITRFTIVEANPRVLSLYGYEQSEIAGMTMADISWNEQSGSFQLWSESYLIVRSN